MAWLRSLGELTDDCVEMVASLVPSIFLFTAFETSETGRGKFQQPKLL